MHSFDYHTHWAGDRDQYVQIKNLDKTFLKRLNKLHYNIIIILFCLVWMFFSISLRWPPCQLCEQLCVKGRVMLVEHRGRSYHFNNFTWWQCVWFKSSSEFYCCLCRHGDGGAWAGGGLTPCHAMLQYEPPLPPSLPPLGDSYLTPAESHMWVAHRMLAAEAWRGKTEDGGNAAGIWFCRGEEEGGDKHSLPWKI